MDKFVGAMMVFRELYFLRRWTSICISLDLVNNDASLYLNGENQDANKKIFQKNQSWREKVPELSKGSFYSSQCIDAII